MTDTFEVQGDFSPAESFDHRRTDIRDAGAVAPAVPNGFLKLGLAPELIRAVEDLGFTQPTAVQEQTIPLAMAARTTSAQRLHRPDGLQPDRQRQDRGLPAARAAHAAEAAGRCRNEARAGLRAPDRRGRWPAAKPPPKRPSARTRPAPRNFKAATPGALILCPTRELAQQVAHDAIDLVQHCRGLRVANVVGGMPYQMQIARLQNADLVVATPGRLLDLQRSMQIKLDKVQFLVVDEADRMLDLGFADDLAEVNQLTIERKQTMMFSATFAPRIQQLATRVMRQPRKIQIDTRRKSTPTSSRCCSGPTTPSTSASCWTTGCATPRSTRPSCSPAPRSSATAWPTTCSKPASTPSRCTAP